MKKVFTIKKGSHRSKGPKMQPFLYPFGLTLIGFLLNLNIDISVWFSISFYLASIITYAVIYYRLLLTVIDVKFDESCIYDFGDDPDQLDINKLFGISLGFHHWNSARIGWRSKGDKIELMCYAYVNKERVSKRLITCDVNKKIELTINITENEYEFMAEKENGQKAKAVIKRGKRSFSDLFIYKLFPYFGGNKTAPHDMRIYMTDIE